MCCDKGLLFLCWWDHIAHGCRPLKNSINPGYVTLLSRKGLRRRRRRRRVGGDEGPIVIYR